MFDISGGTHKDLKMALLTGNNVKIMESETQRRGSHFHRITSHEGLESRPLPPSPVESWRWEDHMLCEPTSKISQQNPRRFC